MVDSSGFAGTDVLALHMGARVFVTSRDEEKRKAAVDLGAEEAAQQRIECQDGEPSHEGNQAAGAEGQRRHARPGLPRGTVPLNLLCL